MNILYPLTLSHSGLKQACQSVYNPANKQIFMKKLHLPFKAIGIIVLVVMMGMKVEGVTRYRILGGKAAATDGTKWSLTSGGTALTGQITWTASDIMIIDGSSGSDIEIQFATGSISLSKLEIKGNKVVTISSSGTCTITLSNTTSPLLIESGSTLKYGSSSLTISLTRVTGGTSTGTMDGTITSNGFSNCTLSIGLRVTVNATGSIYGDTPANQFPSFTVLGTFNTSNFVNSTVFTVNGTFTTSSYVYSSVFTINVGGLFKTSYSGAKGWWGENSAPTTCTLGGTIEYNGDGQIITDFVSYGGSIIFSGSGTKTIPGNIMCEYNITIQDGSVVLNPEASLTVYGILSNNAGLTGLILESDATSTASLVHFSSDVEATIERYIANNQKWHFLSSPIANQAIWPEFAPDPGVDMTWGAYNAGSPYNWDFYYYNPNALTASQLYWVNLRKPDGSYNDGADMETGSLAGYEDAPPSFVIGRGYLVSYFTGWNPATSSPTTHEFAGTLNTGEITVPVVSMIGNTFNLLGNPYPSSIDWMSDSWDRSPLETNDGGYDYWIYNDGTGNYGSFNSYSSIGTNGAGQYIASGQAFFVKASTSGNVIMNDAIRANSTQPWLKNTDTSNNFIQLKITASANTYSDEMIVDFNEDYTGGGTEKFWSFYTEAPELYSVKDGNNYSIDRYNALTDDMKVDIAAKTGVAATYTITATNIADFTLRDKVYLLDMKTGVKTNLKQTPSYSFAGTPDDDRNRFQLIFGTSIGTDEETASDFTIYASDNIIYIRNDKANEPYTVMVSNMLGQIITRTQLAGNTLNQIELKRVPGVYVVTVYSEGKLYSRKVIVK